MKSLSRKLRYFGGLVLLLKNWPQVLGHFLTKSNKGGYFRFRNGLVMRYAQWVEVEEVLGTFVRRDYGTVSAGATVVDVGASLGSFSLFAARQGARVLAFEPAPESFALLTKNIKLNRLKNRINSFRLGVAGRPGKRPLFLTPFSPLSSFFGRGTKAMVDCTTLEEVFRAHRLKSLDLLKLDCEGAEYEILYQTPPEILKKIKEIRLEYHVLPGRRTNPEGLTEFLVRRGFALVYQRRDASSSGILHFRRLQSE